MKTEEILTAFGFLLMFIFLFGYAILWYNSSEIETINIESKETKYNGGTEKYLIFTNKGVYEATDSFLLLHFSSSDIYHQLKIGSTCKVKTYGWRIPFFSSYNDIVKVISCGPKGL